jgi:hypothetical protein
MASIGILYSFCIKLFWLLPALTSIVFQQFGAAMVEGITSDETSELSIYAKRLPKPKRTGDPKKDTIAQLEHEALQAIILILQRDTNIAPLVLRSLQADMCRPQNSEGSDNPEWPNTYHQLWRLPKYYKAMLPVKASKAKALTDAHIEAMNTADPEAVDHAFYIPT